MKRVLIGLLAALPLALAPAAASADSYPGDGAASYVAVAGTVVSVDATSGSFVANAFVVPAPGGGERGPVTPPPGGWLGSLAGFGACGFAGSGGSGGSGWFGHSADSPTPPSATQVTITTGSSTRIRVNEQSAGVGDLAQGDRFFALFNGSPGDSIDTVVANPALGVFARTPPKPHQLYAFVGSVTAVDPAGGSVTVDVSRSFPSSLVPAGSAPVQFTVDARTLVLGGNGSAGGLFGGSLANVSPGDTVAGGLIGDGGLTLAQVQALPLRVLLDLPAAAAGGSQTQSAAQTRALKRTLSLLGAKKSASKHHKRATRHAHHTRSRARKHARRA